MINAETKDLESLSVENTPRDLPRPKPAFVTKENLALMTDLYQLTMGQVYFYNNKNDMATFDLFVRKLPRERGYLVAAGLEQTLFYLENMQFSERAVEYLRSLDLFSDEYLDHLSKFKFTGNVDAVPEGTPVFENEPIIRITAPRIEAQLIETYLLSVINYQTLVASKAARVVDAAAGRPIIEFGMRRAPADAVLHASRAAYIAGCAGTSNVGAGFEFGIPVKGTMAHAMVLSFDSELEAFEAYSKQFPNNGTFLVDTYDTIQGTKNAIKLKDKVKGVRLDSGDKLDLSKKVKQILVEAGLADASIFVSDDMNEYKITALTEADAPTDAYGIGTEIVAPRDAPTIGGIYKLAQDTSGPKMKLSENKATLPGVKQIYRVCENGKYVRDVISLEGEVIDGKSLLVPIVRQGELIYNLPTLQELRQYCLEERAKLPDACRRITGFERYPVSISDKLQALTQKLTEKYRGGGE